MARYEGHLAQFLGDGVLAYFGYPTAHEDDAERAVRAGLDSVAASAALMPLGVPMQSRIGIATGLAVVGDRIGKGADWEVGVVGEAPNLAARLQDLARPGQVVIGARTHRLLGSRFRYEDLGEHDLNGFAAPVRAFRVLASTAAGTRFKALRPSAIALVGRRVEQMRLRGCVRSVASSPRASLS